MFSTACQYNSRSVSGNDHKGGEGRDNSLSDEEVIRATPEVFRGERGNMSDLNMAQNSDYRGMPNP
jgi:hypothetical protein